MVDTHQTSHGGNTPYFRFELSWFSKEGFHDRVAKVWNDTKKANTPMQMWQNKIRVVRKFLKGWAKNVVGENRIRKNFLVQQIDVIDRKSENVLLTPQEIEFKNCLNSELAMLPREEEIYWLQRSKATRLLKGDDNTKYFQLLANGHHRKTRIFQLEQDEGVIVAEENLKNYIIDFYKELFGELLSNNFFLDETVTDDIPQVSDLENPLLTDEFTEKEVREAIFQMEHNKAPGLDGFPAEFYQYFWETIKQDLLQLFNEFHLGNRPLHSLNFEVITLLPKKVDAVKIQPYRPIYLLNVRFKTFTKVLTNRITLIAHKLIRPSQTAFLPGRYIMEGVVILHETLYEMHRKKSSGVILKLDFEKAYDKVKWPFLQQVLRMKGFSPKWCSWINQVTSKGSACVKVNNDIGRFFSKLRKGFDKATLYHLFCLILW